GAHARRSDRQYGEVRRQLSLRRRAGLFSLLIEGSGTESPGFLPGAFVFCGSIFFSNSSPSTLRHEIDRLRALATVIGFGVEGNGLAFIQRAETRTRHRGYVHEHVAASVVGRDEPVALFAVEKLHGAGDRHDLHSFNLTSLSRAP